MEVQGSYGRLIQGMSQQPASVRLQGQVTYQKNTVPDVVDGIKTRPGTVHVAKLLDCVSSNIHTHHYRRGDDLEEYFIITPPNGLPIIFDKNGAKCNLTVEGDFDKVVTYVGATIPSVSLKMLTVADFTFIVNTGYTVRGGGVKSSVVGNSAIVFSAFGQYGTSYRIFIDGIHVAEITTPDGGEANHVNEIRTDVIASKLLEQLNQHQHIQTYYDVVRSGPSLFITAKDPTNTTFSVTTEDGAKGKDLVAIKNRVTSTDLLPANAPVGYKVQVAPTGSKPESIYWLEAEPKEIGGSVVTWKETIAPDISTGFNLDTMPHVLVREDVVNGIATFKLRQGEWDGRGVGDEKTNPFPSFLDQKIGGLFMVQNRLCFTSGEAVSMSRTSRFFDFFRPTVLSALDTDPVDTFSDASEVYQLTDAVSLDGDTVLFSRTAQFLLPGDKAITKANAVLRPTTTFECASNVSPVATGDSIMFAFDEGAYSGVREFFTDSTTDTKKAQPTTYHVNRLIAGKIRKMEASSNFNRLFVLTDKDRELVYVYDWLWQGQDKAQSAWHIWGFPTGSNVHAMFYSTERVYIIITRTDGVTYLEYMEMGDPLVGYEDDQYRVDRGVLVNFRWNIQRDMWVSDALPYRPSLSTVDAVMVGGCWDAYRGGSFTFTYDSNANALNTTFDLGDTSSVVSCYVGETYQVELEPTPVLIKDSQDRVSYLDVPTVGQVWLNTDKAPPFVVRVTYAKTGRVREMNLVNRTGGALSNIGGRVGTHEFSHRIPIRAKSTDVTYRIIVNSPHTFQLRDIEWDGSYNPRRRRM